MAGADYPAEPLTWDTGRWFTPPPRAVTDERGHLLVTAAEGGDFWRTTSYGFIHDNGHALLSAFPVGSAVEVGFIVDYEELYDQAGVMVRVSLETWVKAGVERSDGLPQLGAVVTHGVSDWSMAPVPEWAGREVTVRVSRAGDALTVRARCEDGPWRLVRVAPLAPEATAQAGPFCCAPLNAGLRVRFTRFAAGPADESLH